MKQTERILRHLEQYGTITPMEALEEYGVYRLGARIFDLKRLGYPIESRIVTGKNRFGEVTRYSSYTLEDENKKAALTLERQNGVAQ